MKRPPVSIGIIAGVVAAAMLFSTPARAQVLVGGVVEEGTGQPLVGAFVQLEDSTGNQVAGVLSDASGRFVIRAPAGRYTVAVDLIGYAGARAQIDLPPDRTARLILEIPVEAVSLGGIRAEVGERCHRRPGSTVATARLWEEARKALEVTRWAGEQRLLRFRAVEYEAEVASSSMEVLSRAERGRGGLYGESPYQSIPAEALAAGGYIQQGRSDVWNYYAPDAEVLLSASFLDHHCFRAVPGRREERGLIGLGFEPVAERELPDIEGVLWMDESTGELRRLDFTYVGLPLGRVDWPEVGGRVEFERLATGMWIVRRWYLRMPLEAVHRRGRLTLVTLLEQGAEIRSVRTVDGTLLADAGATLYGRAAGPDGEPLAGATVEVLGADARARTGPDGTYRLRGLPDGPWVVRVVHSSLAAVGLSPERAHVELAAGRAFQLNFHVRLHAERARAMCMADGWRRSGSGAAVLHGRVLVRESGEVLPGAAIRIRRGDEERRAVADDRGAYRVCLEPGGPVTVTAARSEAAIGSGGPSVEAAVDQPGFVRLDVTVPATSGPPGA